MWDEFPEEARPAGWIELDENGWGAVAAWFAGPENVRREPAGRRMEPVRVTEETADGTVRTWEEPMSAQDVHGLEDDIDAYLQDAGLPPRPRGYRWFLRLPEGVGSLDEFRARLDRAAAALPPTAKHPRDIVPALEEVIRALYGRS